MMKPIVNNNGDTRATLIQQRRDAMTSLRYTIERIREMSPHGRNYQTYPDDTQYKHDVGVQATRLNILNHLLNEIEAEAIAILNQGK